jgi:hypothetical protein
MTMGAHHDTAAGFVEKLAGLHFENAFNPYTEICPNHDLADAAIIRRRNLELVLAAAIVGGVDSIWIARDLGYRGGRRTGLALTDEVHLSWHAEIFAVPLLSRATVGPTVAERTAAIVWRTLRSLNRPVFLWNVFPLHPHEPGDPMSNRCHNRLERTACQPLLLWLLEALQPKSVVAIGRDAQAALRDLGIQAVAIRHPSYGGEAEFVMGLAEHYGMSLAAESTQMELV